MWNPNTEFVDVLEKDKVAFSVIETGKSEAIIEALLDKYASGTKSDRRIFEELTDCSAFPYVRAYDFLFDFPSNGEVYVFYDFRYGRDLFAVNSFADVIKTWMKCSMNSIYIADINFDYLVSVTEEGSILGCGAASDWIEQFYASGNLP